MLKKSTLYIVLFVTISAAQAWLKQSSPPSAEPMEPPPDSSQSIADRIVASPIPVLVDFWAVWCGPCRMLTPTIESLKKKYEGKILVMKVNVDANRALAAYFRIQAIPAVYIIANKSVVNVLRGLQPKEAYEDAISKVLSLPAKPAAADSVQTAKPSSVSPGPAQSRQVKSR